ncbi:phage tail protein, partial [Xenorhabdus mauleonii]
MTTKYFALLTQLGADKLANAAALGTKLDITHMAVGDGGGTLPTPDTNQTKLVNECRRAAINVLSVDPKNTHQIIAEQVIPESEGGWWIREIGLFDKDGILIAVGNCAETYKPQLQEGSGRTQTLRMVLIVSHTEAVTLKIDPSVVLATREYADALVKQAISEHEKSRRHPDATLREKGFVMLSNAVDSYSETQAATPRAVKTAHDLAAKANQSANNALEKSKNGADIPNKNEFVKNLGLIAQGTGNSTITVMSQKAVTDLANKKADAEIFDSSGATRIFNSPKTHYIRVSHGGYLEFRRVEDDFKIVQFTPDGIMTDGEIPINFVSGFNEIFVGSLGHFPFRATQLPKKWYALNGDRFSITSAQGKALKYLP